MLTVTSTLNKLSIPTHSVARAIQATRELVSEDTINTASSFITKLINVVPVFKDTDQARVTALALVEAIVRNNGEIADEIEMYNAAVKRAEKHMKNPANAWMYVKEDGLNVGETLDERGDMKVVVLDNGKIRRGDKGALAESLFKKHILNAETPISISEFNKVLITEAQFSVAGARTYSYNLRKKYGVV